MKATMHELPSGRMIDIENIIYIGEIKETTTFWNDILYKFEVVWAGREKVEFTYKDNKEKCVLDWENLKFLLKNHTSTMICD